MFVVVGYVEHVVPTFSSLAMHVMVETRLSPRCYNHDSLATDLSHNKTVFHRWGSQTEDVDRLPPW